MGGYEGGYGGGCDGCHCYGGGHDGCYVYPKSKNSDSVEIVNTHDITEEDIQKGASEEFCKNEAELLGSKTVSRIINLVERKNWEQSPTEPESYVCDEIYNRFIKLSPISKKERDYLLSFFENEKTKSTAQEIVSKLNIQHGPENKIFIRHYLENLTGENDVSKALKSILYTLKNYPFVVDFDFEKLAYFKDTKIEGQKYFTYSQNDEIGLMVTVDNKIFCLDADFENLTLINDYGLIFGSVKGKKIEGVFDTDIMTDSPLKYKNTGVFCQFNGTGFDLIYGKHGIKQVNKLSSSSTGFLISLGDNEEQGVLKVSEIGECGEKVDENGKKEFKVEKILEPKFNSIQIENEFIFGFTNSGNVDLKALEIYNLKGEKSPVEIEYKYGKSPDIEFFNKGENLALTGKDGRNIYRVYKNNETSNLIPIIGLQGLKQNAQSIQYISEALSGEFPAHLEYLNGKNVVAIIKSDSCKELIKLKDNNKLWVEYNKVTGLLSIGYHNSFPKYVWFYKDGRLYPPKKGYKFSKNSYKKGIFGKWVDIKSFDQIKDFIKPVVNYPVVL